MKKKDIPLKTGKSSAPNATTTPDTANLDIANLDSTALATSAFDALVQAENDAIGLLAYGLHTQNGREWIKVFLKKNHRMPTADEWAAFSLAEQMPSRLISYRLSAETLLNQGNNGNASATPTQTVSKPSGAAKAPTYNPLLDPARKAQSIRYIFGMLALVVAMAVLFRLAGYFLFGTAGR